MFFVVCLLMNGIATYSATIVYTRWELQPNGGIEWQIDDRLPHSDHVEMSGKQISVILRYGVNSDGAFFLNKSLVWPLLRTIPNDTHASLMRRYNWNPMDVITINGRAFVNEKVECIKMKGLLTVESSFDAGWYGSCKLIRTYLPSVDLPALVENYLLVNTGKKDLTIEIPHTMLTVDTDAAKGVDGSYTIETVIDREGYFRLQPNDTLHFSAYIAGYKHKQTRYIIDGEQEKIKREELVQKWMNNLILETPDESIDRMFAFSKIRACESIYETKGGPMHGPGGESYYAAIWANDQAEYINPYFPFMGYEYANQSALNAYKHFARFMNDAWSPIPSSIVAEGTSIWNGVGDRGDAAMIAYGATRYVLARGNLNEARELWPLITWCLEYCHRHLNQAGVVTSDTDELENRFPSGKANLCTSSLYYDALNSAVYLAKELHEPMKVSQKYQKQAKVLRQAIENYFGAQIEGFDTYAYFKGNEVLRSWICMPLTVGINERSRGTIDALFSPHLWTDNGLLTQAGSDTFWDRSTLYALRGVYAVGETSKATDFLHRYSVTRLLGEHVPYPIEAWPEGGQRHLSAESGLYGRIITEGLFGIRPTGLHRFDLIPRLPKQWDHMALKRIHAFDCTFDVKVVRLNSKKLNVTVISGDKVWTKRINEGEVINIVLK